MLELFKTKKRSVIGVDLSATAIKLMEVSYKSKQYCIENCVIAPLPHSVMEANSVKNTDAAAQIFKEKIGFLNISSKLIALAVPDCAVITKTIQMDESLSEHEIEEMVFIEADKYIPYPIEEINLDFSVLGPSSKNASMVDVLLVASRAENVSSRVQVIEQAGFKTESVDVESFAIERAFRLVPTLLPDEGKNKTIALVDIGSVYTNLYIMHNLKIIFSREEEFGCEQLVKEVANFYGLSYEKAHQALETRTLPESFSEKLLQPFKELLVSQLKRTLQFFFSTSNHSYIDYILLAGGVTKIPDLDEAIEREINIPTQVINPLSHMKLSPAVDKHFIEDNGPLMLISLGLALRNRE